MSNYPSELPSKPVTAPGPDADTRAYTADEYLAAQALFVVRYILHRMSLYTRPHGDNFYVYDVRQPVADYAETMSKHARAFAYIASLGDLPYTLSTPAMRTAEQHPRHAFQWAFHVDLIARVAEQVVRIEKGEAAPRSLLGDLPLTYFGLTPYWWKQNIMTGCMFFEERERRLDARRAWFERLTAEVLPEDGSCDSAKPTAPQDVRAAGEGVAAAEIIASAMGYPTLHTSAPVEDFDD